ncbi:MAG: fasciclin domain-containing protein [Actinobacteria bacterium]|jgi:uncharacterized surface protein with fasciclin (FAS1) repeats|uniref:Unannotated protein n=1 Tax=freshwater metagenome TaxID=449393 RepID=A0A6J6NEW7_9ZZZZ|nr:fasciclin domain-containing protein [Actinomycetota bacterium]
MKVLRKSTIALLSVTAVLLLSACSGGRPESTEAPVESEVTNLGTVVDVAVATPGFETLVAAITAAELVDVLSLGGPFTVFAPTDDAFAALPAGVLEQLLLPSNKAALIKILTYHVIPGQISSSAVQDGDVPTVEGQSVTLATMGGVTVNGANVVTADVLADNGVIHAIDAVILPPDVKLSSLAKK